VVHNEALKKYITARLIKMLSRLLATLVPTQKEKKKKKKKKKKTNMEERNMQVVVVLSTKQIRKENRQGDYHVLRS
jgi:Na+-transporting methylmalonyl-CoA/oxaloacetate decarboxylase gamma subunit